ncbi:MAG: hypothetical protein ACI9DC_005570 [Gammaproteobacteria bacterium]|jgi:hypothetical protein
MNILKRLTSIRLGSTSTVLFLHADGVCLYGAVVQDTAHGADIVAAAQSSLAAIEPALEEVVARLRERGVRKMPKSAVLLSASAIGSLIELPVSPDTPRPDAQMSELVRWELEADFARQNERWSIGALLAGRGYLDTAQRKQVMCEMASQNTDGRRRVTVRFGEAAQRWQLVSREQIGECLELQEQLMNFGDELVCGWAPQFGDRLSVDDTQTLRDQWMVVGVGDTFGRRWIKACAAHGVFLERIAPELGAGFHGLPHKPGHDSLLVDVSLDQVSMMCGRLGALCWMDCDLMVGGIDAAMIADR